MQRQLLLVIGPGAENQFAELVVERKIQDVDRARAVDGDGNSPDNVSIVVNKYSALVYVDEPFVAVFSVVVDVDVGNPDLQGEDGA